MNIEELNKRFTYHAPQPGQPARYEQIRFTAKELAITICSLTPESREQSLAITALEECVMWANASIARREEPVIPGKKDDPGPALSPLAFPANRGQRQPSQLPEGVIPLDLSPENIEQVINTPVKYDGPNYPALKPDPHEQ